MEDPPPGGARDNWKTFKKIAKKILTKIFGWLLFQALSAWLRSQFGDDLF